MIRTADISACGTYRYSLTREWDGTLPRLLFVMLNPSTADADKDDATIRRCIGFARREGFGSIEVVNLYAFRATDPKELARAFDDGRDIQGPDNLAAWAVGLLGSDRVIAAWGSSYGATGGSARHFFENMDCLGRTKEGHPKHPVRLAGSTPFVPYCRCGERAQQ